MSTSVIAIDPAPGKYSTVFDGEKFRETRKLGRRPKRGLSAEGLGEYLQLLRGKDTLVCWDAPLTGPRDPGSAGKHDQDFTKRPIDQFFSREETDFNADKVAGISVRMYSGLPHWTITRSLLGLPRVGCFDADYPCLPFHLLPGRETERRGRPEVVEIHPGLAAWLWCDGHKEEGDEWKVPWDYKKDPWAYKKDSDVREGMWEIIRKESKVWPAEAPEPKNDDQFDAAVGWLLGRLYVDGQGRPETERPVMILGDRFTGSFLLPSVTSVTGQRLKEAWCDWWGKQKPHGAWLKWQEAHGIENPCPDLS